MKIQELEKEAMRQFVYEHGAIVHHEPKLTMKLYLSNLDQRVSNEDIRVCITYYNYF